MSRTMIILVAVLLVGAAAARAAGSRGSSGPQAARGGHLQGCTVFDSQEGAVDLASLRGGETLRLSGQRHCGSPVQASRILHARQPIAPAATGRTRRIALSMLGSAILPGLGELYLYFESRERSILARVPVFFALEGYLWYGYYHNHSKGKDIKEDYMDFADEHWSVDRFLTQHPCCAGYGGCDDWDYYNENCRESFHYFPYVHVTDDEEEYYENLGKYDAFVYGWDDWAGQFDYWTPNRRYYWSLRDESDKYLVRADNHLMLLIVSRVVSMLDAGWLAYKMGDARGSGEGWSFKLDSTPTGSVFAVRYRF